MIRFNRSQTNTTKPCPFCNAEPVRLHMEEAGDCSWITCMECDATGPVAYDDDGTDALEMWNTRHSEIKPIGDNMN